MTFDERVEILKAHAHGGCRRIGLPGYEFDSDGLHGFAGPCWGAMKASCPTTFPAPPTLGNAWNLSAVRMMGSVISTEHRAWHNSEGHRNASTQQGLGARSGSQTLSHNGVNVWGPTLNVNRDPRWCARKHALVNHHPALTEIVPTGAATTSRPPRTPGWSASTARRGCAALRASTTHVAAATSRSPPAPNT